MLAKSTLVSFLAAALSLAAAIIPATPSFAHGVIQLDNGRWWNGEGFVEQTMYSVEGRLQTEAPAAVDGAIDLGGGWIVPPLADAHSHALADAGFEETSQRLLARGIFYVQNPNSLRSWTDDVRAMAASPETVDVIYSLGCLTASGGHPIQIYDRLAAQLDGWSAERMRGEAYYVIDDEDDLEATWPGIVAAGPDFLKVILEHSEEYELRRDDPAFYSQRGLDPRLLPQIVARAHSAGLRVAAHVATRPDFATAVASGTDEIAHLPLEKLRVEDAAAAADAGVVVTTTTLSHRPTDGIDVDAVHRYNLELLLTHGVRLVLGTDSDRTVLDEARNLERLGVPRDVVLRLAVQDTAQWIFPERQLGRLDAGAEASFLVLPTDPRQDLAAFLSIQFAMKSGHPIDLTGEPELPGIAQALAHVLMRDGVEAALAEYRRSLAEEPDAWDFGEQQLNGLGYFALQNDRPEDAVVLFELNAERFPESSNVWDSLGDGLAAIGATDRARASYERAIQLDPDAENSRQKLEELGSGADRE